MAKSDSGSWKIPLVVLTSAILLTLAVHNIQQKSRFELLDDGGLGPAQEYGPMLGIIPRGPASRDNPPTPEEIANYAYTDGNGFDEEGNLWVTLPAANKLVAITPDLDVFTVAHDPTGDVLREPTNVTWGGDDMRDLYIGSIGTDYLLKTRSPIPGMRLVHQK